MTEIVIGLLASIILLMAFFFGITMISFNSLQRDNDRIERSNNRIQDKLHEIERDIYKIELRK